MGAVLVEVAECWPLTPEATVGTARRFMKVSAGLAVGTRIAAQ